MSEARSRKRVQINAPDRPCDEDPHAKEEDRLPGNFPRRCTSVDDGSSTRVPSSPKSVERVAETFLSLSVCVLASSVGEVVGWSCPGLLRPLLSPLLSTLLAHLVAPLCFKKTFEPRMRNDSLNDWRMVLIEFAAVAGVLSGYGRSSYTLPPTLPLPFLAPLAFGLTIGLLGLCLADPDGYLEEDKLMGVACIVALSSYVVVGLVCLSVPYMLVASLFVVEASLILGVEFQHLRTNLPVLPTAGNISVYLFLNAILSYAFSETIPH